MVRPGGRSALVLVLLLGLFLSSVGLGFLTPANAQQPYSVTIIATCEVQDGTVSVPILLDGVQSGFQTPHTFMGLVGFHNFSLPNEHATNHFIQGPPTVEDNITNTAISTGVNWIILGPPKLPNDEVAVDFRYGPKPFIENFRDTFEPGSTAKLGIEIHMDPSRTAQAHLDVYDQNWPIDNTTRPFFTDDFSIQGNKATFEEFQIPANVPNGTWGYRIDIKESNLDVPVNATFEVASPPSTSNVDFPSAQILPYSTFDVQGIQYAFFETPNASAVVLYVGGGIIGNIGGPTPIDGYSNIDVNSGQYRVIQDLVKSGLSVVTPIGAWEGVDFPAEVVAYLRGMGVENFYAIGHSAGGVVVASSIVNQPYLFSKAVIADAPLTQESTGFYFTDLSIRSQDVRISHLLVWGRGDQQARLGNAYAWMDHANQSLATLSVFEYDHDWAGTAAEAKVRSQIINFFTAEPALRGTPTEKFAQITGPNTLAKGLLTQQYGDIQPTQKFRTAISQTHFGSALVEGVQPWLQTLSPWIVQLRAQSPTIDMPLRLALYPLELIADGGAATYNAISGEFGAMTATIEVAFILGIAMLGIPLTVIFRRSPIARTIAGKLVKPTALVFFSSLGISALGETVGLQSLLIYSAMTLTLTSLLAGAMCASGFVLALTRWERAAN